MDFEEDLQALVDLRIQKIKELEEEISELIQNSGNQSDLLNSLIRKISKRRLRY